MTTADRIVVMNAGRVEQAGSPEEVFVRPCSEFVARFLGGTNILRGAASAGDIVHCGPLAVRCGGGTPATHGDTPVSIRPTDVQLLPEPPGAEAADVNAFAGLVLRHTFLGAQRDYLLELPGGQQIRATVPLRMQAQVGSRIGVRLPPEHCRALPH